MTPLHPGGHGLCGGVGRDLFVWHQRRDVRALFGRQRGARRLGRDVAQQVGHLRRPWDRHHILALRPPGSAPVSQERTARHSKMLAIQHLTRMSANTRTLPLVPTIRVQANPPRPPPNNNKNNTHAIRWHRGPDWRPRRD
jgi:hypothetical protein